MLNTPIACATITKSLPSMNSLQILAGLTCYLTPSRPSIRKDTQYERRQWLEGSFAHGTSMWFFWKVKDGDQDPYSISRNNSDPCSI